MSESLLELLHKQIDITRVPFSDRGSRILVYQHPEQSRLYIKLAERLLNLDPDLEAYLRRPAFVDDLCLLDANGNSLDFETAASAEAIQFNTGIGCFNFVFQDANTLALGLPAHTTCGVRFLLRDKPYQIKGGNGSTSVRNLACMTNGRIVKKYISEESEGSIFEYIIQSGDDCAIAFQISGQSDLTQHIPPFSQVHKKAKTRWQDWFDLVPPVAGAYQQKYAYAWWVLANNLISPAGHVTREAIMPSKAFYVGIWLWDSALHAIALRHADIELARDQLRVMLDHQLLDGMLPDAIFDEGVVSEIDHPFHAKVTKPPILAWAALKLHESHPDLDFLREIYPRLVRCNTWWFEMNDDDADGLVQYTHPYSSGLDNSPLWDHELPVEAPDINTYLVIQMDSLAIIADALGKRVEAVMWRKRSKALVARMIEDLWDPKAGLFRALHNEIPIPVVTPFNLYPLWTGKLPQEISKQLLLHLRNPHEFWGRLALPTVARSEPSYDPEIMWRGPIWANINYFFIEALQKVGETNLADQLRNKTLNLIMSQPGIYEYYNSENGKVPHSAIPMFGWTAAVFIELALQATAGAAK